jgi:hypothetical protein
VNVHSRTGFRPRGHAFLADEARKALGITGEIHSLSEVPFPLVHTAFGAAVCGAAVLLRPEALGLRNSAIADAALALFTALMLAAYDLIVYPRERRPGLEGLALPVAAVGAFATVLAGVTPLTVRAAAGVVAALVIGGVPQLALRRKAAAEGGTTRLLRDMAGIAVLAPVMVAGTSSALTPVWRFALVGALAAFVSFDALRTDGMAADRAVVAGLLVGAALAGAAALLAPGAGQLGVRAAILLLLWYGLRGVAGAFHGGASRSLVILEYAAFVALALGALRWLAL